MKLGSRAAKLGRFKLGSFIRSGPPAPTTAIAQRTKAKPAIKMTVKAVRA